MEVITIPGYTDADKLRIAERYLVPRQQSENGLKRGQARFTKSALRLIIDGYTREAGVRELERQIGAICRGIAAQIATGQSKGRQVSPDVVREMLGADKYVRETALRVGVPGVVTGLAYTPVGGEVLFVEATRYGGKGSLQLTGQIGDVMKESALTALSLVRSRAESMGMVAAELRDYDYHVHVPAGAVPKDGPSAGVAMFTALASLMMNRPVRPDLAMTGEITLRGLVLPIGGLKEKTLAALRAGIRTVLIPEINARDIPELPDEVKRKIKVIPVANVDEVLKHALKKARA
jgi:ATP-dependent Lon protease